MKNFSNTKVVLVTTIPALEAQAGMIDYTFLLPGKKDRCKAHFPPSPVSTGKTSSPDHLWPEATSPKGKRTRK